MNTITTMDSQDHDDGGTQAITKCMLINTESDNAIVDGQKW